MERLFVDFLSKLHATPKYVNLLGAVIIDVWKQKQAEATALHLVAQRRLNGFLENRQRLIDAFVYKHDIDRETYQEQMSKLNEEIALAEINERDARIEELDVEAAVSFGEFLLLNASRLWTEMSLEQKQRLQQVIFPRGVQFEGGIYRTAETSLLFYALEDKQAETHAVVALAGRGLPSKKPNKNAKTRIILRFCLRKLPFFLSRQYLESRRRKYGDPHGIYQNQVQDPGGKTGCSSTCLGEERDAEATLGQNKW
jgi:hypothetical protein